MVFLGTKLGLLRNSYSGKEPKGQKNTTFRLASSTTIGTYTIHSTVGEKRVYVHREKCAFSRADSFGSMRKVVAKALVAFLLFFILRLAAFPMILLLHGGIFDFLQNEHQIVIPILFFLLNSTLYLLAS